MATKRKPSAKKRLYCVWADYVARVYQDVEATTPRRAYAIAKRRPEFWQPCVEHDHDGYRLSNEVQDAETLEFFAVRGGKHCKTCGSEIVETINGSNFREGECGPCEYQRYLSQAALLDACKGICGLIYRDKRGAELIDVSAYERAERTCEIAITHAYGDTN